MWEGVVAEPTTTTESDYFSRGICAESLHTSEARMMPSASSRLVGQVPDVHLSVSLANEPLTRPDRGGNLRQPLTGRVAAIEDRHHPAARITKKQAKE
jgi:hypothetical protein